MTMRHRLMLIGLVSLTAGASITPAHADRAYLERFERDAQVSLGKNADDAPLALARYGTPDADNSSAYEDPRPPLVTRFLEYRGAGVRVGFIANESLRAPPPDTWKLIGFIDIPTNQAIPFQEGDDRLKRAR
jgi:hypothetical protein